MDEARQRRRALGAVALVGMAAGVLILALGCSEGPGSQLGEVAVERPARASPLVRAVLGDEAAWEEAVASRRGVAAVPPWFAEELFSPDGALESSVSEDGRVVGLVLSGTAAQRAPNVSEELVERGWVGVPSGVDGCATFVKEGGLCRWAMVSCIDVPGGVSVVVQVAGAQR